MPAKRAGAAQSPSFGNIGVLNQRPHPPVPSPVRWDPRAAVPSPAGVVNVLEQPVQGILTVALPEVGKWRDQGQAGHFLDRCYRCKQKLPQNQDVYMYGSLRAFCSLECRDQQIAMDEAEEPVPGQSTGTRIGHSPLN